MPTKIKKRKVMGRDHDDIANFITTEKERRESTEWRKSHELRWKEVDRQIAMDSPYVVDRSGIPKEPGTWHNAIQLGDLTDASETITADILRLVFPTQRKFFVPHVELKPSVGEDGELRPVPPQEQRAVNGLVRSFMVQQHKDFGVRGRIKLALKEILHHGSVVLTVDEERLLKFDRGTRPEHLKAPVPQVHSMWNCYPDSSPSVQNTEIFYKGSMIIVSWIPLKDALERRDWINKDKLQEQYKKKDLHEHVEIIDYYGDIFLRRHDGNVLFPNRKTTVSGAVFLASKIHKTSYNPIIYTGYERDDIRDPYYTSPIVKRAPMAFFATHMANRTMDSVDLKVEPPISYDSMDNSMRGDGPQIYPGAKIPSRNPDGIKVLDVGSPEVGLAAMSFAKQAIQEGTTVDAVRKGVAPGTEQTATEVLKTEQRAEVREVEFTAALESELIQPYLIMQHDLNRMGLERYRFYNDEPHSPDYMHFVRKDIQRNIVFEVTGSRTLLGEQERTERFIGTANLAAQSQQISQETDWPEVARQLWEDSKQKDPERFTRTDEDNEAAQQMQQQMQQQLQQMQQQVQQAVEAAQKAEEARRAADIKSQQLQLQNAEQEVEMQQEQFRRTQLQEEIRIMKTVAQAEDRLEALEKNLSAREDKLRCEQKEAQSKGSREAKILEMAEKMMQ